MDSILSLSILFAIWLGVFKIVLSFGLGDPTNHATGPALIMITTIFSLGIWAFLMSFFMSYGTVLLEAIIWIICKIGKGIVRIKEKIVKVVNSYSYLTREEIKGGYLDFRFEKKNIKEEGNGE